MGRVKRSNALSRIFMRYVLVMLGSLVGFGDCCLSAAVPFD